MPYIFPVCYGMRQILSGCVEILHIRFYYYKNNLIGDIVRQVSQCYFPIGKVILKPNGFSDILFALKLSKAITLVAKQI